MEPLGKGLAFAALVAAATALELNGKEASGLWFLVVIWVIFGTWQHSKKCDCKEEPK